MAAKCFGGFDGCQCLQPSYASAVLAVTEVPPNCGTDNSPPIFGGFGGFDGCQCFQPSNASLRSAVSAFLAVLKLAKVLAVLAVSAVLAFLAVWRSWRLSFSGGRAVSARFRRSCCWRQFLARFVSLLDSGRTTNI